MRAGDLEHRFGHGGAHAGARYRRGVLLADLVATSAAVAATSSRRAKVEVLAEALRRPGPEEAAAAVAFLSGVLRQRQIGVGWAALRSPPAPAGEPSLTVAAVDAAFARIGALAGAGSQAARRDALGDLYARATGAEQEWLTRLLLGDVRQGALAGVMVEAIARAAEVPAAAVRRALMLHGDLPDVAGLALGGGEEALATVRLEVGRAVQPMLARSAPDVGAALERIRPAAVEFKLDGMRAQVHRDGRDVAVFTRTLDDVTARLPDVVAAALTLPVSAVVLDGEAIALRDDGRPHLFQDTASGAGRLSAFFFDVLHLDGDDLLDRPGAERAEALAAAVPEELRIPRVVAGDPPAAQRVLDDALGRGHEGVMVKSLDAPYEAGRRGAGWLKVKPVHTLDLVVLAAEWGHGRRRGTLSNLHLGTREGVMLGKTFKGLTDAMLAWQTDHLLALETHREGHVVFVRPELVVEIAFDALQRSTRYPGGITLRFARVVRHRPDKPATDADTLDAVLATQPR
jgi:DNA ligase 1